MIYSDLDQYGWGIEKNLLFLTGKRGVFMLCLTLYDVKHYYFYQAPDIYGQRAITEGNPRVVEY